MKIFLKTSIFLILSIFLVTGYAMAIPLGSNITISDEIYTGTSWYSDREDQEVEPNCVTGQAWDLEGFFLNADNVLTMVGGFNFKDGYEGYKSGDIFIDTTGDAKYGPDNTGTNHGSNGYSDVVDNFGYEYALEMDFTTNKFTVHNLTDTSTTVTVYYGQNDESNPWIYKTGGTEVGTYDLTYYTGLSDSDVGGLLGGTHYAVSLDLDNFLTPAETESFIAHFTIQCGNDNLMAAVPEPATMLLFGTGLIGLAGIGRKKFFKKG